MKRPLAAMLDGDRLSWAERQSPAAEPINNGGALTPRREKSPISSPFKDHAPQYTAESSIVLLGMRGAGKTTLAVMMAAALKKRIVDVETIFQRLTGLSSSAYKKEHGASQCQQKQGDILQDISDASRNGCIIACSWTERCVMASMRRLSSTNAVIHVFRSLEATRHNLKKADDATLQAVWQASNSFFRSCSNLEFFNVTERMATGSDSKAPEPVSGDPRPYLALKQAERHLLKFLVRILPEGAVPYFESAFPLSAVPTENRAYTYALGISSHEAVDDLMDIEEHTTGVDAIQIGVDLPESLPEKDYAEAYTNKANEITQVVGRLRRKIVVPIIVHVHYPNAATTTTRRLYVDVVAHAMSLAPEMITIDLNLGDSDMSRLRSCNRISKLVAHYATHLAQPWESSEWALHVDRAWRLGLDMVRLTRPATRIEDNYGAAHFRSSMQRVQRRLPVIAYNTGHVGRHSAAFNPILTVVASQSQQEGAETTALEASKALFASFLFDPMNLYVFGAEVDYSVSPAMHNAGLEACGIPHVYSPYSTSTLGGIQHLIQDPRFGGASVGLPFKVEVITLTHSLSPHAQAIGAVNTLIPIRKLRRDGSIPQGTEFFQGLNRRGPVKALYGDNTDWIGIRACIRRGLSPANAVRPTTCGLVIGAGGMSRAAVYALLQVGVSNIAIFNRTVANGIKMANHFKSLLQKKEFEILGAGRDTRFDVVESLTEEWPCPFRPPSIIISGIPTHPIGDVPSPEFQLPEAWLANQTGGVILELGYKTLNTPLLTQARQHASQGWVAMDGLDLLPDQGFAQFELFTGRRAPRRVMRRAMFESYKDEQGRTNVDETKARQHAIIE